MEKMTLDVQGMTCGHCKAAVTGALKDLSGVKEVEVDLDTGKVDVTYENGKVSVEQMKEAIEDQGYDVA
ncbi:copper chaperone CopZ [Pullulanibacillus camelliae]|uniref:Copper chaperone CopZ n=1 Tax=Pullulanibacillus camelliae TaxID=1707096 RepID=A0A8J2VKC0_9BACL|nr:copper chaperone CopZ [Pullulanibacillus camelliae]GGE34050.1 copper chaperone CopZ [Pullulanibacillus camelliae]